MMRIVLAITIGVLCTVSATSLRAQTVVIGPRTPVTTTATIARIDLASRLVALRGADGSVQNFYAPPEFTRIDELRVGDTVTITYYESIAYRIARRGDHAASARDESTAMETTSALPGAVQSRRLTKRVTVTAVDRRASSIRVRDGRGGVVSMRVEQASDLDGVKPGDHIDVTYTEAVLATVSRAK